MESLFSERVNNGLNSSALFLSALITLGGGMFDQESKVAEESLEVSNAKKPNKLKFDSVSPADMVKIFNGAALEVVKDGYKFGCQGFLVKDNLRNYYYVRTVYHCIAGKGNVSVKFTDVNTGNEVVSSTFPRKNWTCDNAINKEDPGCYAPVSNTFLKKLRYKKGITAMASYFDGGANLSVGQHVVMPNRETNQWFTFKVYKVENDKFYMKSIEENAVTPGFGSGCQGNSGAAIFLADLDYNSSDGKYSVKFKLEKGRPVVVGQLSSGVYYPGDKLNSWTKNGKHCSSNIMVTR